MSVRKLVLVPEALWQRCTTITNSKQSTMANIKRPVENALYESVSEMNNAVVDPMLSDSEKVDKHVAALNDLSVLKERMKANQYNYQHKIFHRFSLNYQQHYNVQRKVCYLDCNRMLSDGMKKVN